MTSTAFDTIREIYNNPNLMEENNQFYIEELYEMSQESDIVNAIHSHGAKILDAKYEKANLDKEIEELQRLNSEQKSKLKSLLYKYESLFDGSLGK